MQLEPLWARRIGRNAGGRWIRGRRIFAKQRSVLLRSQIARAHSWSPNLVRSLAWHALTE